MLRYIFRGLALVALAFSLVTAVLDLTKSIADSAWVFTSMRESLVGFFVTFLEKGEAFVTQYLGAFFWDPLVVTILEAPAWGVFFVVWMILTLITRGPQKKHIGEVYK